MDQETGGKKSVMYIRERGNRDPDAAFHYPRSALPLPTRLVLLGLAKELPENLWLRRAL